MFQDTEQFKPQILVHLLVLYRKLLRRVITHAVYNRHAIILDGVEILGELFVVVGEREISGCIN